LTSLLLVAAAAAASSSDVPQLEAPPIAPLNRQLPEADERYDEVKVLVAGATGGVGKAVVRQLAAQGIAVRALSRSGLKAAGMLPPASQGVEIVEGDVYRYSDVAKAMKGW
jgi:FlaA1/EpsC-like NDP-sugar epimerase